MSRLAAGLWVSAYLMRLSMAGIPAYVQARGDGTAGSVLVRLCTLDGRAVALQRQMDLASGGTRWGVLVEGPEPEVEAAVTRARSRDPDLWVIAVDDARGRHLLDEPGLE